MIAVIRPNQSSDKIRSNFLDHRQSVQRRLSLVFIMTNVKTIV